MSRLGYWSIAALLITLWALPIKAAPTDRHAQQSSPTPRVLALKVYPPKLSLSCASDVCGVLVQAELASGLSLDVSPSMRVEPSSLASIEGMRLRPRSNGKGRLVVRYGGQERVIPLEVSGVKSRPPVSFRHDVMPIFMRYGCNAGSCHGAALGKNGFRLSLFGFDPDGDHFRLTRQMAGRRLNLARPEDSLMLTKTSGAVSHGGGQRFSRDSLAYRTLRDWLRAGAPKDPAKTPTLVGVELYPPRAVLDGKGDRQRLLVIARRSDGQTRDVTASTLFLSNNAHSAAVSPEGVVSADHRGEAFVMARYGTFTVGAQIIVRPKASAFKFPEPLAEALIDRLVNAKLRKLHIPPSELCSDAEFIRRVTLDVVGRLPSLAEQRRFHGDKGSDRRGRLIDGLLERREFAELWVLKWSELLQIRSTPQVGRKAMLRYYNWLKNRIASNVPMDKLVRELLGATGGTFSSPPTNYYQLERSGQKIAENVAQVFLGMRIQCAQCHNHPFDRWTQNDYYGFAAFFAQVGRKRGEDPRETIIFNRGRGETKHLLTKRVMAPKFLGGPRPNVKGKDRRVVLAAWLTSKDNPFFARNLGNLVWGHFFGSGAVEPVDDVRVSNPSVNPELSAELGRRFTEYRYDFKRLVRDICRSRAYQRSSRARTGNRTDQRNFSHARVRRIKAEVLLDCISQVTETTEKFRGLPRGARAVEIADGRDTTHFLRIFGRPKRASVCSCEVKFEPNLSQALHLINGATVTKNIQRGRLIPRRLKAKVRPLAIVDELYQRCLCRLPKPAERARLAKVLAAAGKARQQVLEDLFWALLNSREFIFNH